MRSARIQGIDFHCHLDLFPDFPERVDACDKAEIVTLAVTTTPMAFVRNLELAIKTTHVRAAIGLHPQVVATRANEIRLFAELLPQTRYVGEVGLDASRTHFRSWTQQQEVFAEILRLCASAGEKILSVHSARCAREVLDAIERLLPPRRGRVVLHWFTGGRLELSRAIELGCYFSVNASMLRSQKSRELVCAIPVDRLLTESDGPFQRVDGHASTPLDMPKLTRELAVSRSVTQEYMHEALRQNFARLVRD